MELISQVENIDMVGRLARNFITAYKSTAEKTVAKEFNLEDGFSNTTWTNLCIES